MEWFWVIPDPNEFVSGGNIYNLNLLNAVAAHHVSNSIVTPANLTPKINHTNPDAIIWDTYYLDELTILDKPHSVDVFLLVHMITNNLLDRLPELKSLVKGFITTSHWSTSQLLAHSITSAQILTLEPGAHLQTVDMQERHLPSDKLKLILVGNLVPEKGQVQLFQELKNGIEKLKPVQIDLYGDDSINPEWSQYLLGQIEYFGLSGFVHYKGKIPHLEMQETMNDYHALLSVSPVESYGMAIREALNNRLPVLAISGGHVPFLVKHEYNGYLFDDISGFIQWLTLPLCDQLRLLAEVSKVKAALPNIPSWENQALALLDWMTNHAPRHHAS